MKTDKKLTFIDLFSGCGGLSEGFLQTGAFEALAHVEWEVPMVETLRRRLVEKWGHSEDEARRRVIHFDIQMTKELIGGKWSADAMSRFSDTNHNLAMRGGLRAVCGNRNVNLIIGGPPCQAYSIAGRAQDRNSMKLDYRNYLFESFVKVVDEFRPDVFVFENVPGLLSACPGDKPVTQRIHEAFSRVGYEIRPPDYMSRSVYVASEFGVPQKRNRVIVIGTRGDAGVSMEEIYAAIDRKRIFVGRERTVRDAIGDLPRIMPLTKAMRNGGRNISHTAEKDSVDPHHKARYHNARDMRIFHEWITKRMNDRPSEEKISYYNRLIGKSSNHAKYRNLEWDRPSPTIVAHLHKDGLMFIHPDVRQCRSITVREAALLQSFPEDYEFMGSMGVCYRMIGNAVPPLMARSMAEGIASILSRRKR
jgi:DNA (cytosine-5)-methyltransferase 1